MRRSDPTAWTISSVKSGHLTSVICGQPTSVLTERDTELRMLRRQARRQIRESPPGVRRAWIGRTIWHRGYAISQRIRKRVEEIFG